DHLCLCLEEAGHSTPVVWQKGDIPGDAVSITYDADGNARDLELYAGSRYRMTLTSCHDLGVYSDTVDFWVGPKPAPVAIQGTMLLTGSEPGMFLSGDSSNATPAPDQIGSWTWGDLSPDGTRIVYTSEDALHVCNVDGSEDAALPVFGSRPIWSPDGRRIAFLGPTEEDSRDLCIVNADGSGFTQISHLPGWEDKASWSPDGQYVTWAWESPDTGYTIMVAKADGTEAHPITGPGKPLSSSGCDFPAWSPDGKRIALGYDRWEANGDTGTFYVILGTVRPDGSDPQTIAEYPIERWSEYTGQWWIWLNFPEWSPDGSQIAYFSTEHVLPDLGEYADTEVYLVPATGGERVRVTYDFMAQSPVSWSGPNTPAGPNISITICDTTITFENVAVSGLTTAMVSDAPPAPEPEGFQLLGDYYYDISTDAEISGTITVQISYDDTGLTPEEEAALQLLHWDTDQWVNITVPPVDTVNNIVTGECTSLSTFMVALQTLHPTFVSPLSDGTSVTAPEGPFKQGRTIPVKFRLRDLAGNLIPDEEAGALTGTLQVFYEQPNDDGTPVDPGDAPPDIGDQFRYDADDDLFIFNLSTKSAAWVADFTYGLEILIDGVKVGEVYFSLR
ncbi:MAG: hypothetical protein MUQ65_11385, partial [Armatimonadetes bacterium]|nr:hypothetical protein [Armatimonadota bacterium]